jgi:hypothetical protein
MEPDEQYDERRDRKPHPNGTLLTIWWPEHGLATVKKCPVRDTGPRDNDSMSVYACLVCRHLRGFFSPGRQISGLPISIEGHNRVLFQQVICEHPAVRRKGGGTGDSEEGS